MNAERRLWREGDAEWSTPLEPGPEWLDGPGVVGFIEAHTEEGDRTQRLNGDARLLSNWRRGSAANYYAVDKVLTKLGMHTSELPPHLATSPPRRTKERNP